MPERLRSPAGHTAALEYEHEMSWKQPGQSLPEDTGLVQRQPCERLQGWVAISAHGSDDALQLQRGPEGLSITFSLVAIGHSTGGCAVQGVHCSDDLDGGTMPSERCCRHA